MRVGADKRSAAATPVPTHRSRDNSLDGVRGAAILLMMVDHGAMFATGLGAAWWATDPARLTLGRIAMPLFFLVAGHLAGRLSGRHLQAIGIGLVIPQLAPVDNPNVLIWWAVGSLLLWACRFANVNVGCLAIVALGCGANHWLSPWGGYDPLSLVGLMAVGAMLPRSFFAWGNGAPDWVMAMGRAPLRWYVGHLLVLVGLWWVIA